MGDTDRRKSTSINMRGVTPWLALALAVITFTTPASASEPRVVCYYTNWSVYRPGTARFNPQNINPYLCTHLIYAFGGFTKDNALKPFDKYQDIEKGGYAKFTGLKTYNKNLKTLLAIGGWNEGSSRFSPMVASRERRKEFVRNAIKFLRQNRFDGLDLDWEYPAFRDGGKPKDRENYAKLVRELREEFEKESEKTGKPRLLLTMAVPAGIEYIQKGFDVKTLNQYLDWMNLLTYDYHSAFEPAVNHHAPLYPLEEPNEYSVDNELNIDYTVKFYIENGADPDKLVLGIPTYGRSYTLFNADATDIGSPADGPGEQGDATREKGYLAYYEICEALMPKKTKRSADSDEEDDDDDEAKAEEEDDQPWTVVYPNAKAMGPVAYKGNQWVGYDDIDIVKKKAEYVAEYGLGGIMFWSIDNDDFRGKCHSKPYPLIESAKEAYINKLGSTDNVVVQERPSSTSSTSSGSNGSQRRKNRLRSTTTTEKPAAAKSQSNKRKPAASLSTTTPAWNIVTPEPPTTPDPGSDFKCKDEGFFPHPRDCKKYFWCLDSGPSNLGIVAHHFTCPSGLFFNKAADSCDFARNVLCKPSTSTAAPATKATKAPTTRATTTEATTTTRRAIRLSTKNSLLFRTTTTTTTVEPEPEEDFDEIEDDAEVDAEDPRVIKELIDLIKKVGGVEQLEKHLHLAETSMSDSRASTTPATFKKELYQKVLQRTLATTKISNSLSEGQNSRRGPQNAGLEAAADADKLLNRNRPQYKTISRSRPSTTAPDTEDDAEEPPVAEVSSRARAVESGSTATTARPLQYVNIRRARPSVSQDTADDTASRNALFERSEPYVSLAETPSSLDIASSRRENTPEYVTIRRQRPTTEEATTAQYQNTESQKEDSSYETILEKELSSSPQPQYTSIVRARSTTSPPEEPNSPEPTTILAVQISSLLNSPIKEDATTPDAETATPEATETEPPTTIKATTTTAAAPQRRVVSRRRGITTTTTTTSAPTTTTQVSPRNYTFVRRRGPLPRPNEINSNLEDIGRKIRSTTPDSLEDGVKVSRVNPPRRFRPRGQTINQVKAQPEDSVPAAASPVSRGQFRPNLNHDEVISLTPIDIDQDEASQFVPRDGNIIRNGRRFRPRTTTVAERVADSEISAATVEVQRQSFVPRGRSRFVPSTTEANTEQEVTKTTEPSQRRPTFSRFTPRPFSRPASSTTEASDNLDEEVTSAAPKLPSRLPFGRTRPSGQPDIQSRKLPFPLRRQSTTQPPIVEELDDLDVEEDKDDDIKLSETAIEEKEHTENVEEPEELPKRRVIIKKTRPSITTEENIVVTTVETPTLADDTGRKKFRVIKRRPTSTTAATDDEPSSVITEALPSSVTTEAPSSPVLRIRKVIRKKINKLIEEPEPEIIAKSIGSLKAQIKDTTETIGSLKSEIKDTTETTNYGEKTRSTIISSSSTSMQTEELVTEPAEEKGTSEKINLVEDKKEETDHQEKAAEVEKEEKKSQEEQSSESDLNSEDEKQNKDAPKETDIVLKPEAIVENIQSALDISDQNNSQSTEPPVQEEEKEEEKEQEEEEELQIQPETTTKATTQQTSPSVRTRLPYRPPKRVFTSTTPSSPASSRTYSRKYNAGAYTSPATVERASDATRSTRKPFFSSNRFRGRPFTTARTTKKAEEDEEYADEELFDVIDQEPEDELVVVPPSKLFTRKPPGRTPSIDDAEETVDVDEDEDNDDEEQNKVTSKKPFKARVVNSNTFRTSTSTTELPKQGFNRTAIYNRFGGSRANGTKKRVQNVPVGYNSGKTEVSTEEVKTVNEEETTTVDSNTEGTTDTDNDDYLSATEHTSTTNSETTFDTTNTDEISTATEEIEFDFSTDDYLVFTDETTVNPTTLEGNTNTANDEESTSTSEQTTQSNIVYYQTVTTEPTTESATEQARVEPIVKTQFDKLFSVSRVVEVSSKLDKHRVNKKNESRLVEEGTIMQEKKPTVDKIGEVSRFSLIKIFENEIPIYLTKLGHVYPVDNPPDNPIRIDEARNARALLNFKEGRENLIASESVNEAYRHINKIPPKRKDQPKPKVEPKLEPKKVEHIPSDDFLSFINDDKKTDEPYTLHYYQPDLAQWQFIPAAYENEKNKNINKVAKTFEVVTPRNMFGTDPSTLPLEGLFKTEVPAKKINPDSNQPFVVYSAASPSEKDQTNIVKLEIVKPESRSIKTYVKGQELDGAAVTEESTVKYPLHISVLPQNTQSTSTTAKVIVETITSGPLVEMLTTSTTTVTTELTTITTTDMPTVTETIQEETTTQKSLFDAKRPKFAFPRRPVVKSSNTTLPNPVASLATLRKGKAIRSNSTLPVTSSNQNKTSGFNPSIKSRLTVNRSQNVPVDLRNKKPSNTVPRGFQKSSTETPKTTTERRLYVKPIRPNLRPAFVPRRVATTKAPKRVNFPRRTKATAPTETDFITETIQDTTTVRTSTRRGNSKFKTRTKDFKKDTKEVAEKKETDDGAKIENRTRQPFLNGGAKRSERPTRNYVRRRVGGANATTTTTSTTPLPGPSSSRRPFRVTSRRRPVPASSTPTAASTAASTAAVTTTSASTAAKATASQSTSAATFATVASEESLQDLDDRESLEEPALKQRTAPLKKTVKIQRRPLTSLKEAQIDQNPSATNEERKGQAKDPSSKEEDRKRQSKKYSSSFKQNQLDEVLKQKSKSQEEFDDTTIGTGDDYSAETAVAIAAHQLLAAPLPPPSPSDYEDEPKPKKKPTNSYATTQQYQQNNPEYTTVFEEDFTARKITGYPSTPNPIYSSSTPFYRSTSFVGSQGLSSPTPGYSSTSIPVSEFPKIPAYSSTLIPVSGYLSGSLKPGFTTSDSRQPSGFTTAGFSIPPALGPSTARYLESSNKYAGAPVEDYGYTNGGPSREPSYFTREYLLESPVTKTYDDEYQYLSPVTTTPSPATKKLPKKTVYRKISTTVRPTAAPVAATSLKPRRVAERKPFEKVGKPEPAPGLTYRPIDNYDYYDDSRERLVQKYEDTKVIVHGKGNIECLDIGNFPHPSSCKKFISCARMESGAIIGWQYVCPEGLSFDPVGGICNWSAGLGCDEK